jgi:hypothetical protein
LIFFAGIGVVVIRCAGNDDGGREWSLRVGYFSRRFMPRADEVHDQQSKR